MTEQTGETPEKHQYVAANVLGCTKAEASAIAETVNCTIRVAEIDGESLMLTRDFRPDRLNVGITAGRVTTTYGWD